MIENDHGEDERRQAFRIDMENEIIDISWSNEQGESFSKRIACIDFSKGGLKVNCDSAIEVDAQVTIIFRAAHESSRYLKGKVLRCLKQNNGWFDIGIQLDSE